MAEWRVGRDWTEEELADRLRDMRERPLNFAASEEDMTTEGGWRAVRSEAVIGREGPGAPEEDGAFVRARQAVAAFQFSDPRIVVAHFEADRPLESRTLLLELKVFGLHYLCGARVTAVREEEDVDQSLFGWRYDTLEGHIEAGFEWFFLAKEHATGEIRFSIRARWRLGDFPNRWSRLGFHVLGPRQQERWHRHAHGRLAALARMSQSTLPVGRWGRGRIAHEGPAITFTRGEEATWPS